MAHELTMRANGMAEMAYTGAKGWHGLGQALAAGASLEQWAEAAGMLWHVRRAMVRYFADPEGSRDCSMLLQAPERDVLFRSDTLAPLGYVSPKYEIVQPRDVLEFFRDLIADHGYTLETAGTLFGGRRLWALAKVAETVIGAGDAVGGYLLLSTSTDGTMETEARETTVRVVCNNTLRMAKAEGGARKAIKVGHRSTFDAAKVKSELGLSREAFEEFGELARTLAQVRVTDAQAQDYVRRLLRPEEAAREDAKRAAVIVAEQTAASASASDFARLMAGAAAISTEAPAPAKRAPRGEADILRLFRGDAMGSALPGVQGTAWGLVNAVTEYVDHEASAKTPDHRRDSAFFGKGDALKSEALTMALQIR